MWPEQPKVPSMNPESCSTNHQGQPRPVVVAYFENDSSKTEGPGDEAGCHVDGVAACADQVKIDVRSTGPRWPQLLVKRQDRNVTVPRQVLPPRWIEARDRRCQVVDPGDFRVASGCRHGRVDNASTPVARDASTPDAASTCRNQRSTEYARRRRVRSHRGLTLRRGVHVFLPCGDLPAPSRPPEDLGDETRPNTTEWRVTFNLGRTDQRPSCLRSRTKSKRLAGRLPRVERVRPVPWARRRKGWEVPPGARGLQPWPNRTRRTHGAERVLRPFEERQHPRGVG
jgi:hypothetical protein